MEFYGNNEVDDESCDSYASDDTSESDFDYDDPVDNLDELEVSDEDSNMYTEGLNSINESHITGGGFTSISLKELTPVPIKSLSMNDVMLTLQNAQRFYTLLSHRLPNLKKVSFNIYDSDYGREWKPSRIVDGKNKSTNRIVSLIYYFVDHLQELVSIRINFYNNDIVGETPYFPHLF
ncbi:unnamed protein product [Didymodactylos carnosus]|uniref:Uncharacterized protein n=1 Tax=Didymodactylos carnosus TaxID=1234261 RepID=A0A815EWI4_9BILA|nr:unnamed protein product [Didymodactylos carnosus]CAF4159900.1 unnamed protein product [Didymodactylos carnosus]